MGVEIGTGLLCIETRVNRAFLIEWSSRFGLIGQKLLIGDVLDIGIFDRVMLFGFLGNEFIKILINGGLLCLCAAVGLLAYGIVYVNAVLIVDAAAYGVGNAGFLILAIASVTLPRMFRSTSLNCLSPPLR